MAQPFFLRMWRGSPLCAELQRQIVQQFEKKCTLARNLGTQTFIAHNITKRYGEISAPNSKDENQH